MSVDHVSSLNGVLTPSITANTMLSRHVPRTPFKLKLRIKRGRQKLALVQCWYINVVAVVRLATCQALIS